MINEVALKLSEWYHKANINTVIGRDVSSLVKEATAFAPQAGFEVCPYLFAATMVEHRKEKYGIRILDCFRKQGKEQEGINYLRRHFPVYLDYIVRGERILEDEVTSPELLSSEPE